LAAAASAGFALQTFKTYTKALKQKDIEAINFALERHDQSASAGSESGALASTDHHGARRKPDQTRRMPKRKIRVTKLSR
jgi:hypothetical protein